MHFGHNQRRIGTVKTGNITNIAFWTTRTLQYGELTCLEEQKHKVNCLHCHSCTRSSSALEQPNTKSKVRGSFQLIPFF